jgi:hypothetical protein
MVVTRTGAGTTPRQAIPQDDSDNAVGSFTEETIQTLEVADDNGVRSVSGLSVIEEEVEIVPPPPPRVNPMDKFLSIVGIPNDKDTMMIRNKGGIPTVDKMLLMMASTPMYATYCNMVKQNPHEEEEAKEFSQAIIFDICSKLEAFRMFLLDEDIVLSNMDGTTYLPTTYDQLVSASFNAIAYRRERQEYVNPARSELDMRIDHDYAIANNRRTPGSVRSRGSNVPPRMSHLKGGVVSL